MRNGHTFLFASIHLFNAMTEDPLRSLISANASLIKAKVAIVDLDTLMENIDFHVLFCRAFLFLCLLRSLLTCVFFFFPEEACTLIFGYACASVTVLYCFPRSFLRRGYVDAKANAGSNLTVPHKLRSLHLTTECHLGIHTISVCVYFIVSVLIKLFIASVICRLALINYPIGLMVWRIQ